MTSLVAPSTPHPPRSGPHGRKRSADVPLEQHEQRLSKRFDLLNLENTTNRLYIPVAGSTDLAPPGPPPGPLSHPDPLVFISQSPHVQPSPPLAHQPPPRPPPPDTMDIEDTPHRIFIHSLDAELSALESDQDTPIFLPDIEKHLARIPAHVLRSPEPTSTPHNQLVLYNVPESLSVERERDGVRMAILEARERLRERRAKTEEGGSRSVEAGQGGRREMTEIQGDAMDID